MVRPTEARLGGWFGPAEYSSVLFVLKFRQVSREIWRSMNNAPLKIASFFLPSLKREERRGEEVEFIVSGEELSEFA